MGSVPFRSLGAAALNRPCTRRTKEQTNGTELGLAKYADSALFYSFEEDAATGECKRISSVPSSKALKREKCIRGGQMCISDNRAYIKDWTGGQVR